MKQKLLKSYITAFAVMLGLTFSASAQNFVSEGTAQQYNATCKGVIKMKSITGTFVNNSTTTNQGQGESGNPIDGTVDYGATSDGQSVPGLYYNRMVLTGGNKSVVDGVRITGTECTTPLASYPLLASYPYYEAVTTVSYAGTFYYVGSGTASQTIYPQTGITAGTNAYNILDLSGGGPKDVAAGDLVSVGTINSVAGTPLSLAGDLTVGDGPSTLNGVVTLDNAAANLIVNNGNVTFNANVTVNSGTLEVDGTGDAIIATGATLSLVDNDAQVDLAAGTDLVITGTFLNGGDGTNLDFNCTSTVTYNGGAGQNIVPTIASNSYGNLVLLGGNKVTGMTPASSYGNNLHICTDFSLSAGNLDMYTNSGTLFMTNVDGDANYGTLAGGTGREEVEGLFNRVMNTTAKSYTMNNINTVVTLSADNDNPTSMTFNVRPGVAPFNYDNTVDLNRKINVVYTGNGDFAYQLKVGYNFNDRPNWNAPNTQTTVRMYESDNSTTGVEKIGTGQVPTRGAAVDNGAMGFVQIAGITNGTGDVPNGLGIFDSGNDVLLRTGPTTFYTVQSGRWTNPNVWDEGAIPSSVDNAELRHSIYVGIDGPFINTPGGADETAANNTLRESSAYPSNAAAANQILIANIDKAALIMGNEDNGDGYVFWTASTATGANYTFTNNNLNAPSVSYGSLNTDKTTYNTGSVFNGLWLTEYVNSTWYPTLRTNQLLNKGVVNNDGVIELGN